MRLTRIQHLDHLAGRSLMDVDLDAGREAAAALQSIRYDCLDHRIEPGDADHGALAGRELAQAGFRLVDPLDHALGMVQQQAAGIGQHHIFMSALEQPRADAVLQARQLLRERWLGEAELLAGARQGRGLRDREEDTQLMEGHYGSSLSGPNPFGGRRCFVPAS